MKLMSKKQELALGNDMRLKSRKRQSDLTYR